MIYDDSQGFNGSLATLERIHNLQVDCSRYAANNHIIGFRNNLIELWKESRPFFKTDKDRGDFLYLIKVKPTDEGFLYDQDDYMKMHKFHEWLLEMLWNTKITYYKYDAGGRIDRLKREYGIKDTGQGNG